MEYRGVKLKGIGGTCKDCPERHRACHDHCPKYKKAKADLERYKAEVRRNKDRATAVDRFKIEACIRNHATKIDKQR